MTLTREAHVKKLLAATTVLLVFAAACSEGPPTTATADTTDADTDPYTEITVPDDASEISVPEERVPDLPDGVGFVDAGAAPAGLVAAFGSIWVADHHGPRAFRIDPNTREILDEFEMSGLGSIVDAGFGAVWVMANDDDTVWRIDPESGRAEKFFSGPIDGCVNSGCDLAVGEGAVWVRDTAAVRKLDPSTGEEVGRVRGLKGIDGIGLETGFGAVWTVVREGAARIDPDALTVTETARFRPGEMAYGCAAAEGSVWCLADKGAVVRIDPSSVAVVDTHENVWSGPGEDAISVAKGAVWVLDDYNSGVARLDTATGKIDRVEGLTQGSLWSLTASEGSLWISDFGAGIVLVAEMGATGK